MAEKKLDDGFAYLVGIRRPAGDSITYTDEDLTALMQRVFEHAKDFPADKVTGAYVGKKVK